MSLKPQPQFLSDVRTLALQSVGDPDAEQEFQKVLGLTPEAFQALDEQSQEKYLQQLKTPMPHDQVALVDKSPSEASFRGTRPPERNGVYPLADGRFSRFLDGKWRVPHVDVHTAATQKRLDAFPSPQFRIKDHHRWFDKDVSTQENVAGSVESLAGVKVQIVPVKTERGNNFVAEIVSGYRAGNRICHSGGDTPVYWPSIQDAEEWLSDTGYTVVKRQRSVELGATTLTFSLPDDFGTGWEYTNVSLYGASHAWAGSYNKSENENFAVDVLMNLSGIESSSIFVGQSCTVDFKVNTISEAEAIQLRLQAVVDAFPAVPERQISVRGSNFFDSKVTEHDANDPEIELVSDMPYLQYLAKYIPMAETLPALIGCDLKELRAQAEEHQRLKHVDKDDSLSPSM